MCIPKLSQAEKAQLQKTLESQRKKWQLERENWKDEIEGNNLAWKMKLQSTKYKFIIKIVLD